MQRKRNTRARSGGTRQSDEAKMVMLLRAGRGGEAAVFGEAIVARHPADAKALTYLGMARAMIGDTGGSIGALERAVQIAPKNALAHVQLSNALRMDEQIEDALGAAMRAVEIDPAHELALAASAELLVLLDRAGEARDLLEPVIAGGGDGAGMSGGVGVAWGKVMRSVGEAEGAIDVVRAVCDDARESEDARSGAVFVLGDMLLACGRHDEAFGAFARANEMRGGAQGVGDAVRAMGALRRGWTKDAAARAARAEGGAEGGAERGGGCVFVVGMPRSGTTLVERVLDAHPGATGVGESQIIGRVAAEIERGIGVGTGGVVQTPGLLTSRVLSERGEQVIDGLFERAARAGAGNGGGSGGVVVVDKQPMNFLHLGLIACMLPGARIIHCVRDPRDTCLSCFFQDFGAGLGFTQELGAMGRYYNAYAALMAHWKSALEIEILDVPYELFAREPETWMCRIVAFAGLEWDERCTRFHESGRASSTASNEQVRRPIHTGSIARWKLYEQHLGPLLEAIDDAYLV